MLKRTSLVAVLTAVVFAVPALAQKPVSMAEAVSETFTIEAIAAASRMVTLKDKDGLFEEVWCGPEVQRFDALKVGDKVTFRYHESLVSAIKPSTAAPKPPTAAAVTRTPGGKPGGTISQQMIAVVTIAAIDAKTPAVTVTNDRGQKMSFRVEDPKNLTGYKAGDKVEITYTQALAVSVTPAGK
jgi:Cu/Ag efflux protein CusF